MKGLSDSQAESQGKPQRRGWGWGWGELSKPRSHPEPHLSPGAGRSWTCSRCAARHLGWETADIWETSWPQREPQLPQTTNHSKLENTPEPTPSGQCSWPSVTRLAAVTVTWPGRSRYSSGTVRCPGEELANPWGATKAHLVIVEEF